MVFKGKVTARQKHLFSLLAVSGLIALLSGCNSEPPTAAGQSSPKPPPANIDPVTGKPRAGADVAPGNPAGAR